MKFNLVELITIVCISIFIGSVFMKGELDNKKEGEMKCIDVKTYICEICGYKTDILPANFPKCPECEKRMEKPPQWSSNTKYKAQLRRGEGEN